MKPNRKFTLAAFVTIVLLTGGVVLKQRELNRGLKRLAPVLSAGSVWIVPSVKAPAPMVNSSARVSSGQPRMLHLDPARTNRSPFVAPLSPIIAWTFDAQSPIETAPAILDDGTIVFGSLGGRLFGLHPDGSKAFERDLIDRVYASPLILNNVIYVGSDNDRFLSFSSSGEQRLVFGTDGDSDTSPAPTPWGAITFTGGNTAYALRKDGTVAWRVKGKRKFYSSPAVGEDGTVYVSSQDDRLYAIDKDGKIRFSTELGNDADCAPSIGDDGSIYIGTDGGHVFSIAPSNGHVKWKTRTEGHVRGSVTLTRNGAVVVGTYGPAPQVVSLDASTGVQRFTFPIQGTGARDFGIHGSPVEDAKGNLCFGAQDDAVRCLDASGSLIFSVMTGGDVDAPVVLAGNGVMLVGSDDGKIYCLRDSALP